MLTKPIHSLENLVNVNVNVRSSVHVTKFFIHVYFLELPRHVCYFAFFFHSCCVFFLDFHSRFVFFLQFHSRFVFLQFHSSFFFIIFLTERPTVLCKLCWPCFFFENPVRKIEVENSFCIIKKKNKKNYCSKLIYYKR